MLENFDIETYYVMQGNDGLVYGQAFNNLASAREALKTLNEKIEHLTAHSVCCTRHDIYHEYVTETEVINKTDLTVMSYKPVFTLNVPFETLPTEEEVQRESDWLKNLKPGDFGNA